MLSKKIMYEKFIVKINVIDTNVLCSSRLVSKTQYNSGKNTLREKD